MSATEKRRKKRPVPTPTAPKTNLTDRLAACGIRVSLEQFTSMVANAIEALPTSLYAASPEAELTEWEQAALVRGGLDPSREDRGTADPLARAAADFTMLIASSRSVAETANLLGLHESRIRQRLNADVPSLYGFKVEDEWRIPAFVFEGSRLVPGLSAVVSRLDPSLHPVAFFRWFTTPDVDLVLRGDPKDTPQIPRSWLLAGYAVEAVAELAAEL